MIARVAYFESMTSAQHAAAEYNFRNRFRAALISQPGLVVNFLVRGEDDNVLSFSVWESRAAMEEGGRRANEVPLLPGQRREDIPSPDRVELAEVFDAFLPTAPLHSGRRGKRSSGEAPAVG